MYDVGVRYLGLVPELFDRDRWPASDGLNPEYRASFEHDIAPIIERPADYVWVANVPSMLAFSSPRFDVARRVGGQRATGASATCATSAIPAPTRRAPTISAMHYAGTACR